MAACGTALSTARFLIRCVWTDQQENYCDFNTFTCVTDFNTPRPTYYPSVCLFGGKGKKIPPLTLHCKYLTNLSEKINKPGNIFSNVIFSPSHVQTLTLISESVCVFASVILQNCVSDSRLKSCVQSSNRGQH